jgi:hypothetical protein
VRNGNFRPFGTPQKTGPGAVRFKFVFDGGVPIGKVRKTDPAPKRAEFRRGAEFQISTSSTNKNGMGNYRVPPTKYEIELRNSEYIGYKKRSQRPNIREKFIRVY